MKSIKMTANEKSLQEKVFDAIQAEQAHNQEKHQIMNTKSITLSFIWCA